MLLQKVGSSSNSVSAGAASNLRKYPCTTKRASTVLNGLAGSGADKLSWINSWLCIITRHLLFPIFGERWVHGCESSANP